MFSQNICIIVNRIQHGCPQSGQHITPPSRHDNIITVTRCYNLTIQNILIETIILLHNQQSSIIQSSNDIDFVGYLSCIDFPGFLSSQLVSPAAAAAVLPPSGHQCRVPGPCRGQCSLDLLLMDNNLVSSQLAEKNLPQFTFTATSLSIWRNFSH